MAGKKRKSDIDVDLFTQLEQEPYGFGFYAAMRLIECQSPHKPRIGHTLKPKDDPVRLGQSPSLRFSPSTLAEFEYRDNTVPKLKVYFQGLFGPNGPLPLHLTEYARQRLKHAHDPALVDFLDLFHHRFLSLFYRAWSDKEPTVQMDRSGRDRFAFYVGSLCGVGPDEMHGRDAIPDETKLHFANYLGANTKHLEGLQSMISEFFQLPVSIEEFIGEWLDMPPDAYCYLNGDRHGGEFGGLGRGTTIGTRSWQCQGKFRIRMGPLSHDQFERMLPSGDQFKRLSALVRNYLGLELHWDLNLVMKKDQVPATQLGRSGRLGWTSWLTDKYCCCEPRDDLTLKPVT